MKLNQKEMIKRELLTTADYFTTSFRTCNYINARSVFAIDMDGDGDMDVLLASEGDDTIAWYENDGTGGFTTRVIC